VVAENARLAAELERREAAGQQSVALHAAELEHLQGRVQTAEAAAARERQAREELATLTEETAARRADELRHALEAAGAERDATTADLARARVELDAAAAETIRLCALLDAATEDANEARAALGANTTETDRLRAALDASTAEVLRGRTAFDEASSELARARAALDAAATEAAETRAALASANDTLRDTRVALETATGDADEARAACATLRDEIERTRSDLEAAHAARHAELATSGEEHRRLGAELDTARDEHERLVRELADATTREAALRDDLERVRSEQAEEAAATTARFDALATECEELRARVGELTSQLAEASNRPAAPEPAPVAVAEPAVPPPAAPTGAPPPVQPIRVEPGLSVVVVIDGSRAWENAGAETHRVVVMSPDDEVAARLAELAPKRVVVNLASARALDAVAALRAGGVDTKLWGCLADPGRGRVLPIGMIDVAARPLDPDAVVASLGVYTTRGARVMTIGDDVDAFVSLRQALARQGLSVSMAWNAKQADELLPMVKPAAVVVDMALPPRDGAGIIAQLGACDPVPAILLMPSGRDQALAFLAVLNDATHAERVLPLERLIARVLAK
jgi:CheY-like chemotaxis protein/predicted  nucleic acid-binding Zn-ribbon protein